MSCCWKDLPIKSSSTFLYMHSSCLYPALHLQIYCLSLLGTSLCCWRPFKRTVTLTSAPWLLTTTFPFQALGASSVGCWLIMTLGPIMSPQLTPMSCLPNATALSLMPLRSWLATACMKIGSVTIGVGLQSTATSLLHVVATHMWYCW